MDNTGPAQSVTTKKTDAAENPRGIVTVTVVKGASGYGIAVIGPGDDEPRTGVYISTSLNPDVPKGKRVVSVNGQDMAFATQAECATIIVSNTEMILVLAPDAGGFAQYQSEEETFDGFGDDNDGDGNDAPMKRRGSLRKASIIHPDEEVTVTLQKGENGYGIAVVGPEEDEERSGVFVSRSKNAAVPQGQRVVSVNGVAMKDATQAECSNLIKESSEMELVLVPDEAGYNQYLDEVEDTVNRDHLQRRASLRVAASVTHTAKEQTVTLSRNENGGFGIALVGPTETEQKSGVFVSNSSNDALSGGNRILSINNKDMRDATQEECFKFIASIQGAMELVVILHQAGLEKYLEKATAGVLKGPSGYGLGLVGPVPGELPTGACFALANYRCV